MNSKAIAGKKWNNKIKNTHKIQFFFLNGMRGYMRKIGQIEFQK